MDELEISGKRYISSKQAAKENRYHVDYIGQLIRAGKIVGTKVGRTWYVETNSLATYLDKEVPQTSLRLNVAPTGSKLQPLLPEEKEVSWAYKPAPTQRTQVFPARVPTSGLTYIS